MSSGIGRAGNIHEMVERMAIQELLCAHSRGLDRGDVDLLKACYWRDAEVDYGSFKGSAHEFAEKVLAALGQHYELTRHCLSNSLIAVGGDQARAETLVNAQHLLPGGDQEMCFSGRYLDRLERRDRTWKLIHRRVVMDWAERRTITDERRSDSLAALTTGCNDVADPSFDFFAGKD